MASKLYVVIDVGCHECGVGSVVVGCFASREEAEGAKHARDAITRGHRDGGQTIAEVFEVEPPT